MRYLMLLPFLALIGCGSDDALVAPSEVVESLYFPPISGSEWATTSPAELGWDSTGLDDLYAYLQAQNTRAFIVLVNGKIVAEQYWGQNILGDQPFDQESNWYWASAGKALTAFLVGKAQEEGLIQTQSPSKVYLGEGWSSLPTAQESAITVWHHLTMTTGLDHEMPNLDCTLPPCLQYMAEPGSRWFYHNAPYTLLSKMVESAAGTDYNAYSDSRLEQKIGMSGQWIEQQQFNRVYWSKARDAARFGLLIQANGIWEGEALMADTAYFQAMLRPSQAINPSYGYLWWLNGQTMAVYPGSPRAFAGAIAPNAPSDLVAAMGKNGQFVDVVPSLNMVLVRMGEAPDEALVPIAFHDEIWEKMTALLPE